VEPNRMHSLASRRVLSLEVLGLGGLLCFGIIVQYLWFFSITAIIGTVLIVAAAFAVPWQSHGRTPYRITVAATAISFFFAAWHATVYSNIAPVLLYSATGACGLVILMMLRPDATDFVVGRFVRSLVVVVLVGVVFVVAADGISISDPDIDVLDIHRSAANWAGEGYNPYVYAFAWDSSPDSPEGTAFRGYVYPPSTLAAYVGADWVFGDPRWASALAASVFILLVAAPWQGVSAQVGAMRLSLALLFASIPPLGYMIWGGWTDMLALPFLLVGALQWSRRPVLASIMLGVAFSTKPYFVVALPLLLLWQDDFKWKRVGIVGSVVAATYVPFIVADVESIVGTIRRGLPKVYRTDSAGLSALGLRIPNWLSYVLTLTVGIALGARGGKPYRYMIALAATLAVVFVTGAQVFLNYWLLVVGLIVISLVALVDDYDEPSSSLSSETAKDLPSVEPAINSVNDSLEADVPGSVFPAQPTSAAAS